MNENKIVRLGIIVNEDDRKEIRDWCEKKGINLSSWVRNMIKREMKKDGYNREKA